MLPVWASLVSVPLATLVVSEKFASLAGVNPEPPSAAVHARLTSDADHADDAGSQAKVGAFLSILFPDTGPAVAEFPTASATLLLFVEALSVSDTAATFVDKLKLESPELARP